MASHKHLLLFFYITFLYSATTEAQPTYLYNDCSTSNFTGNSAFQWSRTTLLSSLASDNTANTEFYNTTVANDGQTVYGLFMCRGDVSIQVCHQCVVDAAWKLVANCSLSKKAIIWSDECLLRYSGRSFFSTVAITPGVYLWNTANVSSNLQASFMRLLFSTINETADEAAKPALGEKKFATKEANISEFQTLYCLAQCTPDLSPADCRRCLSGVIGDLPWCCEGKQGGRVLYPSCNIRYELYPFYYMETPPPTPTPTTIVPSQGIIPPANPAGSQGKRRDQSPRTIVVVVVSTVVAGILFCFAYCFVRNKMRKSYEATLRKNYFGSESTTLESLQFSLATIEAATNKFSHENSIGKGGFGEVYKGVLSNGQEIAVKRLSKSSGQGAVEFKNEVLLIVKLQHRNLVALLGFCLEEQEKMLVYEYVPNRSLDYFLFGSQKSRALSWLERCKIIGGIARGILYLHEYSRLKIIHRDLKPNNILLDDEMNPKISDFGMARMVAINEVEGSTNRIVGTYGYMSPEYAMFGQYSEKSDVFSLGVMVLEIVSGKKNTSHHESQYIDGLLSYAWKQWRDENLLEILDSNVKEFRSYNEVIKCIQIGLLCVQENPDARPSMATVVSYLSNDLIQLPSPQEPAFFMHGQLEPTIREKESGSDQSTNNSKSCSINEISVSEFFPR